MWTSATLAPTRAIVPQTRRHLFSVRTIGIVMIATALLAQPALANFTATDAPVAPFNAATIAAPSGLSCAWTSGTAASLTWTGSATSWVDNNYVNRSTNGGSSYAEAANTG